MIRQTRRRRSASAREALAGARSRTSTRRCIAGQSVIGGGATPEQSLATWLIALACANAVEAERELRAGDPPVIARIEDERLVLDLRTVLPDEEDGARGSDCGASARLRRVPGTCLPTVLTRIFSPSVMNGGHLHHQAGFHLGGLGHVRNRGALEAGLGLDHRHIHGGRQLHADRLAFVELHRHLQLRNQVIASRRPAGPSSGASARRSRCS